MKDLVSEINRRYVKIANRVTPDYERVYGLPCDLYFPVYDKYDKKSKYRDMKIFAPHQSFTYKCNPDISRVLFYIPLLIKNEAMNSSELEFDSFYTETEADRPFIETSKKRELPIGTKVVVFQGKSESKFFVDKKLVVTGANGHMLLRMFLAPLAKDCDGDNEAEKQVESIKEKLYQDDQEFPVQDTDFGIKDNTDYNDELEMIIPDEEEY